jgi:ribosomal protein S18 acetylase RimI-like enzyme
MDLHCRRSFGPALQEREIADPQMLTLLAESEGRLIGYGQLRWGSAAPSIRAERPVEILRLYVDRAWHGGGVGPSLMAALLEAARAGGADIVWLGVWEHNPRAIAFYAKHGFRTVGEHEFLLGEDPQRDLVMVREWHQQSVVPHSIP